MVYSASFTRATILTSPLCSPAPTSPFISTGWLSFSSRTFSGTGGGMSSSGSSRGLREGTLALSERLLASMSALWRLFFFRSMEAYSTPVHRGPRSGVQGLRWPFRRAGGWGGGSSGLSWMVPLGRPSCVGGSLISLTVSYKESSALTSREATAISFTTWIPDTCYHLLLNKQNTVKTVFSPQQLTEKISFFLSYTLAVSSDNQTKTLTS